jgi:hypothetical protein
MKASLHFFSQYLVSGGGGGNQLIMPNICTYTMLHTFGQKSSDDNYMSF